VDNPYWQAAYALTGAVGYGSLAPRAWNIMRNGATGMSKAPSAARALEDVVEVNKKLKDLRAINKAFPSEELADQPVIRDVPMIPESNLWTRAVRTTPGARGVIDNAISRTEEALAHRANQIAGQAAEVTSGPQATLIGGRVDDAAGGRNIATGIERSIDDFKTKADVLYREADELMEGATVTMTNTENFFNSRSQSDWSRVLGGKMMDDLKEAFELSGRSWDDVLMQAGVSPNSPNWVNLSGKTFTYAELREMRSALGRKLANPALFDDVARSELKQLYGALSKDAQASAMLWDIVPPSARRSSLSIGPRARGYDMGEFIPLSDLPRTSAAAAMQKADEFYQTGRKVFDKELAFLTRKVAGETQSPEALFRAFESGSRLASSSIAALRREFYKSGQKEAWRNVSSGILTRLLKAPASVADETGAGFSMNTFASRWNQLDDRAKTALFGDRKELLKELNQLARITNRARAARQGKAGSDLTSALITGGPIGGVVGTAVTGGIGWVASAAGAIAGSWTLGQMMTSPRFVRLLSRMQTHPKAISPAVFLAELQKVHEEDPSLLPAVDEYVRGVGEAVKAASPADVDATLEKY
jgi:hypothetical protein